VHVSVQACRRHDVETGRLGDDEQAVEVAADADRGPVDECAGARGAQRRGLLDRLRDVRELVAGLRRRDEEEMLVGIAGPELGRRDVAPDRPDDLGA
jgi:hypothetical protein